MSLADLFSPGLSERVPESAVFWVGVDENDEGDVTAVRRRPDQVNSGDVEIILRPHPHQQQTENQVDHVTKQQPSLSPSWLAWHEVKT